MPTFSNKAQRMSEETVPATEAQTMDAPEQASYECAFHLLPTVADGEVATVVAGLKAVIAAHGGEVFDEEMPERFELAYEIRKASEGRSQYFGTTWFGWMRFTLAPQELARVTEEFDHQGNVLRYLTVKLSREELEHPFRMFEKKDDSATVVASEGGAPEVSETDLNKSLEQITS